MLIKNAIAYVDGKFAQNDILIENGKITGVGRALDARGEIVDARGLIALPGLIDMHVHLREPGETWKEDFKSGGDAAVAGGYALVYDMPNNIPKPTITREALDEKRKLALKSRCEVRFHFGATENNFEEVRDAKPESLKMYLGMTTGNMLMKDEKSVERHMKEFPKAKQIFVHAEGDEAGKAIGLAKKAGRKVHLTHVPNESVLDAVKGWKLATADVAPHHLFLCKSDFDEGDCRALVKPGLETIKSVSDLWKRLDGIDAIATDHAPHILEDKKKGAFGFPGLETALPLFLDAYSRGLMDLEWIAKRFSENPARIMGLRDYGRIEKGCVGSITLVDLKREWTVHGNELCTKAKWSPFEGKQLRGRAVKTIVKGEVAFSLD
ncbi:MAG: dihydroorotase family protein [Candidatus ainarchaeum sp.]|nr:dihydroorotase family protein [Candidatus ainarchaeum sp.]